MDYPISKAQQAVELSRNQLKLDTKAFGFFDLGVFEGVKIIDDRFAPKRRCQYKRVWSLALCQADAKNLNGKLDAGPNHRELADRSCKLVIELEIQVGIVIKIRNFASHA